ncbi:Leucine-rich_repeat [Hexamita inflata]|uniref:Leucine-rich repeat n=1 Tax=Hexamita inflata TaxID=28002 RepID=A0AA86ULT7_9EUKA|nr:Leucine-rich repeat [Hexamita inflata]
MIEVLKSLLTLKQQYPNYMTEEEINLENSYLEDFSMVELCKSVKTLSLSFNIIPSFVPNTEFKNLKELRISRCSLEAFNARADLETLSILQLFQTTKFLGQIQKFNKTRRI